MVREGRGRDKMTKVLTLDQAVMERGEGELEAARDAGLVEEGRQLVLDGLLGGAEPRGDLTVGAAVENRVEDLALAPGQVEAVHRRRSASISVRPMAT